MTADSEHPRKKAPKGPDGRLASALRANLQRRKAQARARAAGEQSPDEPSTPHDSAGIVTDKPGP